MIYEQNIEQLTNIFIKLVREEIFDLELRFKHEADSKVICDKERSKLKHEIILAFRRNIGALSEHYLEQKGNYMLLESLKNKNQTELKLSEVQEEFPFLPDSGDFEDSEAAKI